PDPPAAAGSDRLSGWAQRGRPGPGRTLRTPRRPQMGQFQVCAAGAAKLSLCQSVTDAGWPWLSSVTVYTAAVPSRGTWPRSPLTSKSNGGGAWGASGAKSKTLAVGSYAAQAP